MLKTVSFLYKTLSMAAIASYPAVFQAQNGCFSGLSFNRLSMKEFGNPFSRKQLFLLTTLRNGRPKQLILVTKIGYFGQQNSPFCSADPQFRDSKTLVLWSTILIFEVKDGQFCYRKVYTLGVSMPFFHWSNGCGSVKKCQLSLQAQDLLQKKCRYLLLEVSAFLPGLFTVPARYSLIQL